MNRRRTLQWRAPVLRVGAFEGVCDLEEKMFVGDCADELEANGQICGSETAGDGDGGDTG